MRALGKLDTNQLGLEAVIIYDDLDIASRAVARLDNASRSGDEITNWGLKWWRLEVLRVDDSADEALRESVGAHLVVLALRDPVRPHPSLLQWLEKWAETRREADAAIALFDGARCEELSLATSPELSVFANKHGLSLIVEEAPQAISLLPVEDAGAYAGLPFVLNPGLRAFEASPRYSRGRSGNRSEQ